MAAVLEGSVMPRIQATPVAPLAEPAPTIVAALRTPMQAAFAGAANLAATVAAEPGRFPQPRGSQGCFGGALRWVRNVLTRAHSPRMSPYERRLAAWGRSGADSEGRAEAVRRIRAFLASENRRALNLQGLDLVELPPLPESLRGLNCEDNQLRRLPELPASLRSLLLSNNPLEAWPDLPPRLTGLEMAECNLRELGTLPASLVTLEVSRNALVQLPAVLPSGLATLVAEHNRLTGLPDDLEGMPSLFQVWLHGNPLTPQTQARITGWNALHGRDVLVTQPLPSLDRAPSIEVSELERLRDFEERDAQDPADAFDRFLARLATTVNAKKHPEFAKDVAAWREQLDADADLLAATHAIALGATASCEDRVTLTYLAMRRAEATLAIDAGRHDHDVERLLALLRHAMREEAVDGIAKDHFARRGAIDEIETILHYRTGIGALLPHGAVREGRFASTENSGVTQADLEAARDLLQRRDAEFPGYLSNLPLWHGVLERWNPDAVAAARERRAEIGDAETFMKRVRSYLRENQAGLEDDAAAQVRAGRVVLEQLNHEVFWPLTQQFLQARGVSLD